MADKYWSKVAELTGLRHCPKQGPFGEKDGAVIGSRGGYIVAIGPGKDGNQSSVKIMLRYPNNTGGDAVRTALQNSNPLAVALETDAVSDKHLKKVTIGPDALLWKWEYSFGKPKPEKIAALANALVDSIKGFVPDFQGKCEQCRSASVTEVMLMNNIPVFYCAACQFKVQGEVDQSARAYEQTESNLFLGLMYGGAAACVGAIAWGGTAYLINRIFLWGAILIGYMIAWALIKGMGRINLAGQIAIGGLTIFSVMAGDILFYTLQVMKEQQIAFSFQVVSAVIANFWAIETDSSGGIFSMIFALVGAGYAVYSKGRKPEFKVAFVPLAPTEETKAAGLS